MDHYHDIAVHSASGTIIYRYLKLENGNYRLLENETRIIPNPDYRPNTTHHPDGRMIHPPPPLDIENLPVGEPEDKSLAEQLGGIVIEKLRPHTPLPIDLPKPQEKKNA